MKENIQLTPEQMYKRNQLKSKIFKKISPITFWGFMGLFVFFVILTVGNSWGNISEIISMLDKNKLTGEQIAQNYDYLVRKWGEWIIVGQSNSTFSIRFIDIRQAFFSGLMITYITLAIICLVIAIVLGKVVFPKLAQLYSDNNQDMVNMATLQTNAEIQKRKQNTNKEEWF